MLVNDALDESTCKSMVKGAASTLLSSFKLTYYTLLNLLRRAEGTDATMEYVISQSFSQFQHEKSLPLLAEKERTLREEAKAITSASDAAVEEYTKVKHEMHAAHAVVMNSVLHPDTCIHFLRPGRIVRVADGDIDYGYGVVVSVQRLDAQNIPVTSPERYIIDTLLCCAMPAAGKIPVPLPLTAPDAEMMVVPVKLSLLTALCTLRISIPSDLRPKKAREDVLNSIKILVEKYPDGQLPELEPEMDFKIEDNDVLHAARTAKDLSKRLRELTEKLDDGDLARDPETASGDGGVGGQGERMELFRKKAHLLMEADGIRRAMKESQLTNFQEEAKNRKDVLFKLGHIDKTGVVTSKVGNILCGEYCSVLLHQRFHE